MNHRSRKITRPQSDQTRLTGQLARKPAASANRHSQAYLDFMAENLERGIRDLPVWKNLVKRVGLSEARKILRRGLLIHQITDGSADD
jgi:hypothetical protein